MSTCCFEITVCPAVFNLFPLRQLAYIFMPILSSLYHAKCTLVPTVLRHLMFSFSSNVTCNVSSVVCTVSKLCNIYALCYMILPPLLPLFKDQQTTRVPLGIPYVPAGLRKVER